LADGLIIVHHPIHPPHPPRHPHPPHPPRPWPRPVPPRVYPFAPLSIRSHQVEVTIHDQVAVTRVDQVFYNPNPQRLEGTYLFPIPKGARIDKFEMDVNGKMMQAELLDAGKARKIYEDIVRSMKDPALLEYSGQGAFKVRIFPIEPHSEKRIKLKYTQLLKTDSGLTTFVYPLNTEKFSAEPIKTVSVRVNLETAHPIKSIYSPSHKVEVKRHGEKKAVVGFETKNAKPDTDFNLIFSAPAKGGNIGLGLRTFREDGKGGYFMLLASPGARVKDEKAVPKDVVFVADTSGSMAGDKLDQAKAALKFCVENLNDGDRFEIIRFSTEAEPLFGKLTEISDRSRGKARDFVSSFKPIGGTAIEEALLAAVDACLGQRGRRDKGRPCMVIFLTDGRPTIGNTEEDVIVKAIAKKVSEASLRIFCFGIGTDINTHLLDRIAEKTRAFSQYVMPKEDLEVKVSNFYAKIDHPVLSDLQVKVDGDVRVTELYPRNLPDLFKGQQLVVFGRYTGDGDAAVRLSGSVGEREVEIVYEGNFPDKAGEHEFIPRLWATRRVGYLLDQIRLHGENKELKEEVTRLARQYGVVTPYTSYLIVEDEGRRNVPVASRTIPLPAAPAARRVALEQLATKSDGFRRERSGDEAVAGAASSDALKRAEFLGEAEKAGNIAWSAGPVTGGSVAVRSVASRHVRGRTFYLRGEQWVDAQVQARTDARRVELEIGSDAYFQLLADHPEAAAWLSVGPKLQVLIEGTVYVIK
ncbi:MAG: VIT and VWA domain-containing protein, partial [Phycisphaerae bacterium]|nr:VIT and VWA domain-containing protein [Phycisphaerae bacterium]